MREWKLSASRESRRLRVEARRERWRRLEARQREAAARAAALRAALARQPESPAAAVDRLVAGEPDGPLARKLRELLEPVAERSPRLIGPDTLGALKLMAEAKWVRSPATWMPSGKSWDRLFRSLGEHVLARYRMPSFVWSAFRAGADAPVLARVVIHVAAGGSLYDTVKSGLMPVPLTRRMCHELLSLPGEARILDAVRKVQVKAAGGDARLFRAWIATRAGQRLHPCADEEFWQTVIAWLSTNPGLPHGQVAPLADYIEHRRAEAPDFSMKGRSVPAMTRAMREWHRQLAREKASSGRVFAPSGLLPMDIDRSRRDVKGNRVIEIWHFREILDARTLADEGRVMGHCVYAYARRIEAQDSAIWTLTLEDNTGHWRRLTIEVRPSSRQIVQARGRFNRLPEPRDVLALQAWASRNRLQATPGSW
jgi:PcfJ-like protein